MKTCHLNAVEPIAELKELDKKIEKAKAVKEILKKGLKAIQED